MRCADFDYDYPPALVAHSPLPERDASRLLVLDRATGAIAHRVVRDLPELLQPGDVVVINTSKVIPARLIGRRESGGWVEILLLEAHDTESRWALATRTNRLKPGARIVFDAGLEGIVRDRRGDRLRIAFNANGNLLAVLERIGLPPLPPYIDRPAGPEPIDRERYQTIYADAPGSSAAPTAGLHFTERLLATVRSRGAIIVPLTLHVGADTFAPVRAESIEAHPMHGESYQIPAETMEAVSAAKCEGRRVIAVGTTTVRALESAAEDVLRTASCVLRDTQTSKRTTHNALRGTTQLFIYPGYRFRIVDAILTNFHQPRSTLLMLVAAFAGHATVRRAYTEAIAHRYRLFSYGDAMFVG